MRRIIVLILLSGFLLLFFLIKISQPQNPQPLVLENLCPLKNEDSPENLQPDFSFPFPKKEWYVHQDVIREFEEPLVFPKIKYSLYFSHPVDNINPYHWEVDQRAAIRFLVFKNYCQSLNNWTDLIPGSSKAEKEDFVVDGHPGTKLRHLRGYKDNEMIVFNEGDYHYQFQLVVRYPEDLPYYSEILTQTIKSFKFFQP